MLRSHHHPCHPRRPISDRLAGPPSCRDPVKTDVSAAIRGKSCEEENGCERAWRRDAPCAPHVLISRRRPREWRVPATARGKMMMHDKWQRRYGRSKPPPSPFPLSPPPTNPHPPPPSTGNVARRPISGGYTRPSGAARQSMEQAADNELRKMILPHTRAVRPRMTKSRIDVCRRRPVILHLRNTCHI